jgi:hypothetical protein
MRSEFMAFSCLVLSEVSEPAQIKCFVWFLYTIVVVVVRLMYPAQNSEVLAKPH